MLAGSASDGRLTPLPRVCAGLSYVRGFQPYQGEDPREVSHEYFPFKDGPRGVGWMSAYCQGLVRPCPGLRPRRTMKRISDRDEWRRCRPTAIYETRTAANTRLVLLEALSAGRNT